MGVLQGGKENHYGVSSLSRQLTRHSDISPEETPFSRGRQGDGGVGATAGASVEVMGVFLHGIYLLCVVRAGSQAGRQQERREVWSLAEKEHLTFWTQNGRVGEGWH